MCYQESCHVPPLALRRLISCHNLTVIQITVNGNTRALERSLDVGALLAELALAGKKVAVERNGEIVPRSAHGSTLVLDGDKLEIVVAVGGG
jgi:sulfur carrier protein